VRGNEEDYVSRYRMTLKKRRGNGNWRRNHLVAHCGRGWGLFVTQTTEWVNEWISDLSTSYKGKKNISFAFMCAIRSRSCSGGYFGSCWIRLFDISEAQNFVMCLCPRADYVNDI
jgi:hypothetical protein